MIREIIHVGLTVTDIKKSIDFYTNILGLKLQGQMIMEGEETDRLFGREKVRVMVAYLNGSKEIMAPPIELLQFTDCEAEKRESKLTVTSISEVCFKVDDIEELYKFLLENNVDCISEPQEFDFRNDGFGRSKAIYFKDPDGIILEAIQELD